MRALSTTDVDSIELEALRRVGGLKWSMFPDAIGAFIAEMDFGIAAPITAALHAAVDVGSFGYLPPSMAQDLSLACADWCRQRYGWVVDPQDVRPIADVVQGLELAIEHFSRPGSPVILPTPAYMPFLSVPALHGRQVIEVPMAEAGGRAVYDLEALDAAFRAGGHLLILCNPHNPIGRVLQEAEMLAIAAVVQQHGGRVFSDEIHAPLIFPGHRHLPYASLDATCAGHTVTATSASKAWNLPGMKCAQLILSNDADRQTWQRVGGMAEHGAANLGVLANTTAYLEGGPWLDDVLGYLDRNRATLAELVNRLLPGVRYTPPEGTYLGWLDFRELELPGGPAEYFREQAGVVMTDGARCGEAGRGFARFTFATPRPILIRAIEQLARALPPG